MAVSMTMDDTIILVASEVDDHGDPVTSDRLQLTDDSGVLSWQQSGNTWTGTPQQEGRARPSIADPSAPNLSAGVVDITVTAGAPSAINIQATVNTGANAAQSAAGDPPADSPGAAHPT